MTIEDIKEKENDEGITKIGGTLKAVYDYKSGTAKAGPKKGQPWSFQDLILSDSTGEIKVVVNNKDEIPKNWKGKKVILKAYKGDKGWSGLYAHDHEYPEGKFTRIIRATKSGDIELDTTGAVSAPDPEKPKSASKPVEKTEPLEVESLINQYLNVSHMVERKVLEQTKAAAKLGVPENEENFGGKVGAIMRYLEYRDAVANAPTEPTWQSED
jgi:hypothetical protein